MSLLREGLHLCPAHEDHRPSLSVRRGRDGRWLLHCFTGCRTRDVLKAAGLKWLDLFPESSRRPITPRPVLSPLAAARVEILQEARRAPWNQPAYRLRNVAADGIRLAEQTQRGIRVETEENWEKARVAAELASHSEALWFDADRLA